MSPLEKVITIDGPSASGKSSVSRELAKALGWKWVSTGCFYRGLGFVALEEGVDPSREADLGIWIDNPDWHIEMEAHSTAVIYKGQDVTARIHGEKVGAVASQISQFPSVRQGLLERQRNCARNCKPPFGGLIAEGRDCGTVVFPQAFLKVFLTADPSRRAQRRSEDEKTCLEETLKLQQKRDANDSQRKQAPLAIPEGAIVVDSSEMGLAEVVDHIQFHVQDKMKRFSF